MIQFPQEIMDLLKKGYFAYLCTTSSRNQPFVTPMFFIFNPESGEIYLLTSPRSKKIRNMKKNPKVSLTVDIRDPVNPFNNTGVMVQGSSTIDESTVKSNTDDKIHRQFGAKYRGCMDKLGLVEEKVIVKIVPKRIIHWRGAKFTTVIFDSKGASGA